MNLDRRLTDTDLTELGYTPDEVPLAQDLLDRLYVTQDAFDAPSLMKAILDHPGVYGGTPLVIPLARLVQARKNEQARDDVKVSALPLNLPISPVKTWRCPDQARPELPNDVVGCGQVFQAATDDEGVVDCPACGIWFTPNLEPEVELKPIS